MKRSSKYVALDVHQATTVTSVREESGRVIARIVLPTEAGGIVETSFPTRQGRPLVEPPVIQSTAGLLQTTFDVRESTYEVAGQQVDGKTYGPGILGPTLVVNPGDRIEISSPQLGILETTIA